MTEPSDRPRRRVHRDEGEVTAWPRGLLHYVPSGAEEEEPPIEEDRTHNRILLAGRLLAVLRASGETVDREVERLAAAERAEAAHDPVRARAEVEALLTDLALRPRRPASPNTQG